MADDKPQPINLASFFVGDDLKHSLPDTGLEPDSHGKLHKVKQENRTVITAQDFEKFFHVAKGSVDDKAVREFFAEHKGFIDIGSIAIATSLAADRKDGVEDGKVNKYAERSVTAQEVLAVLKTDSERYGGKQ